ncbi:MAG: type II toxin-antitoxin system VapC family toxin [Thermoguttaceae bacterium]
MVSTQQPTVYLESSVISNLVAKPSSNVLTFALQKFTHKWWKEERPKCRLVVSEFVLMEVGKGDPVASTKRREIIAGLEVLRHNEDIAHLANMLISARLLPKKAIEDAVHIVTASYYRIAYIITWNCKHIANPISYPKIVKTLDSLGLACPIIGTPQNLLFLNEE